MRLRGLSGIRDQFHLAAIAQNKDDGRQVATWLKKKPPTEGGPDDRGFTESTFRDCKISISPPAETTGISARTDFLPATGTGARRSPI
jgi:hypothetical protein